MRASQKVVQGPAGGYARRIQHTERVEYSYDPSTGEASARLVDSTEPVVVARDGSPPDALERQVGAYDVVPEGRDVRATQREDAEIPVPPAVRARLRVQAEREGGPVTRTETWNVEHDLDTQETNQRIEGISRRDHAKAVAAVLAGRARTTAGTVSERAQALARQVSERARESLPETTAAIGERINPASSQATAFQGVPGRFGGPAHPPGRPERRQQQPKGAEPNAAARAPPARPRRSRPSYQQPTIIVVRAARPLPGRRRYGGL